MEDEVCKYGKFGFCKFGTGCKRKHFTKVCENLSSCTNINECKKTHPKTCKRFKIENECRFNKDCAYSHVASKLNQEKCSLKDQVEDLEKRVNDLTNIIESKKLQQLEKVVHALTRKVLSLEDQVKVMKNKKETDQEDINHKCFTRESSFNHEDIMSSTPKDLKEKVKEKNEEDRFKCKECKYKCKKEATLKKHMITNHSHY